MNDQTEIISDNQYSQFQHISHNPNVLHYLNLVKHCMDFYVALEHEKNERDAFEKKAEIVLEKLHIFEMEVVAKIEEQRTFVEDSMKAVHALIKDKEYKLADTFHKRVANNLQGRVGCIAETFNEFSTTGDVFLLEDES